MGELYHYCIFLGERQVRRVCKRRELDSDLHLEYFSPSVCNAEDEQIEYTFICVHAAKSVKGTAGPRSLSFINRY